MADSSSKEIKNRIRSMKSTRQITKAMEMVASSKLRRAQADLIHFRPYFEALYETVQNIALSGGNEISPYLIQCPEKPILYVVIAGDRGLAGGFNSNILKLCLDSMHGKNVIVLPIGKKAADFFSSSNVRLFTEHGPEAQKLSASHCFSLAKQICGAYLDGKIGSIQVGYTNYVTALFQIPVIVQALPLPHQEKADSPLHCRQITYEPDVSTVFDTIIPEYLGGILYGAVCESRAAEQAARRTAMDSATQNADEMIAELNRKYNQARQAAITQQITEIVAGS